MIERRVNRFALALSYYPDGSTVAQPVSTHDAMGAISQLDRSRDVAIAGRPEHLHMVLPDSSRRYLIHVLSNTLEYAFGRICRTNLKDFPYAETWGNLAPIQLDPNSGISYESYFLLHHDSGDLVMEYTSRGPKFGDLQRYLQDKLSGHATVPVDSVQIAAIADVALLDRFLNEMGAVSELQLLVATEQAGAFAEHMTRLGDQTDPQLLMLQQYAQDVSRTRIEAAQFGLVLKREKYAKTGGMHSIKRPLAQLLREDSTMFTSVQGRVEGSEDDGGRTMSFNLLSDRTARRIEVTPHSLHPRYVDPEDMSIKLREVYLKMLGSGGMEHAEEPNT